MKLAAWAPLTHLLTRLAALPHRERVAVLAAGLAVVAAVEWFAVVPLMQRHDSIVDAARAQAQAASEADESAQAAQAQAATELAERSQRVETELQQLGAATKSGKSGQRLADLLARTLQPHTVRMVALRELGVDEIETAAAPQADPADPATATAAAVPARVLLYRHRFELSVAGPVPAVLAKLSSLEQGLRPLRIEQLKLGPADNGEVLLTLVLVGVGTERAWLSL